MKLSLFVLPLCLAFAVGCAGGVPDGTDPADETTPSADALTQNVEEGATAKTTADLRLRAEPSTSSETLRIMARGTTVTFLESAPQNGFYKISADGDEGYASGNYLVLTSGDDGSDGDDDQGSGTVGQPSGESFTTKGTGYYPDSSALEGGFVDRRGAKLRTLQQFLAGQADYVSVAMDSNAFSYGQKLRIKELETKYNRVIEFRVVDTGGAFRGKGRTRMDICTANRSASLDPTINGNLHVFIQ